MADEHSGAGGETLVAAAWDGNAATWAAHVRAGYDRYRELFTWPAFLRLLRQHVPELAGREIIDLGRGEGENTRRLARLGGRMTGIDLSARMIEFARAEETSEPLGITYHMDSFARLDTIGDRRFDAAVSTMALMDGPGFADAARVAHRVLKPGGPLIFSVLHPCFITPGHGWIRDQAGRETLLTVGGYFSDDADVERWRFSKAPEAATAEEFVVPRFRHRLEDYVNGLCAAGFRIAGMVEPRPDAGIALEHRWLRRWREHGALVLLVAAVKPERE